MLPNHESFSVRICQNKSLSRQNHINMLTSWTKEGSSARPWSRSVCLHVTKPAQQYSPPSYCLMAGCPMSLPCLLCHVVHVSSADIPTICRLHSSVYQCNVYDMQTCRFSFTNLKLYWNKNIHYIFV